MADRHRPVFLTLWQLHFPITAIVSIMHRVSGFCLAISLPFVVFTWHYALLSEAHLQTLLNCYNNCVMTKLLVLTLALAYGYHALAGVRHFIMDFGIGLTRKAGVRSAYGLLAVYAVLAIGIIRGVLWG